MKAFITGSHAYGAPTDASDVDLVLRVDPETRTKLVQIFEPEGAEYGDNVLQFKVADVLNLILCVTDAQYEAWRAGTAGLIAMKPVTRDQAIAVLKPLIALAKVKDEMVATGAKEPGELAAGLLGNGAGT